MLRLTSGLGHWSYRWVMGTFFVHQGFIIVQYSLGQSADDYMLMPVLLRARRARRPVQRVKRQMLLTAISVGLVVAVALIPPTRPILIVLKLGLMFSAICIQTSWLGIGASHNARALEYIDRRYATLTIMIVYVRPLGVRVLTSLSGESFNRWIRFYQQALASWGQPTYHLALQICASTFRR